MLAYSLFFILVPVLVPVHRRKKVFEDVGLQPILYSFRNHRKRITET